MNFIVGLTYICPIFFGLYMYCVRSFVQWQKRHLINMLYLFIFSGTFFVASCYTSLAHHQFNIGILSFSAGMLSALIGLNLGRTSTISYSIMLSSLFISFHYLTEAQGARIIGLTDFYYYCVVFSLLWIAQGIFFMKTYYDLLKKEKSRYF